MKIDVEQLILWGSKDSSLCYIPLHCVNICHCDWFNKEADWPITGQDKNRRRAKQNAEKKGGVRGITSRCRKKQDGHAIQRKVPNHVAVLWDNALVLCKD